MNTWYHIKRWFERSKKEIIVVKKTKNNSRKKRDNTRLTKAQIIRINLIWSGKDSPIPDVSNLTKLTKYCNDKLNINKSRSVYHRIVNSEGAYATSMDWVDDGVAIGDPGKNFKLRE